MASDPSTQPSFTPWRKWNIGLHVGVVVLLVLAVVVMLNYLSRDFYYRLNTSSRAQLQLSPLTIKLLSSITNRVHVTIYYDQQDPMYSTVADLLELYHQADPRLTVETVDYVRDPGAAQKIVGEIDAAAVGVPPRPRRPRGHACGMERHAGWRHRPPFGFRHRLGADNEHAKARLEAPVIFLCHTREGAVPRVTMQRSSGLRTSRSAHDS